MKRNSGPPIHASVQGIRTLRGANAGIYGLGTLRFNKRGQMRRACDARKLTEGATLNRARATLFLSGKDSSVPTCAKCAALVLEALSMYAPLPPKLIQPAEPPPTEATGATP